MNIVWRAAGCQWNHRGLEGHWKRRLLQIQMEYWSFITNDDVQVYQSMWIVHNPLVDIKCAFDITGDEKWELAKWDWALREGELKESRQQLSAFITAGVLHIFVIYPASACTKCNTIKWIVFKVKSASVVTGKGCWQCGSIKVGPWTEGRTMTGHKTLPRNWVLWALVILLFNNYGESPHILELDN